MKPVNRNVLLLGLCICLTLSGNSLLISSAALTGSNLAPVPGLVTLPLTGFFIATMAMALPAGLLMERLGRKRALMLATLLGITGGMAGGYAILHSSFFGFVAATVCLGAFNAFGNFFRFAAADYVTPAMRGKAVSRVMIGGVLAAFIGPGLASQTRQLIGTAEFAASYFMAVLLYVGIAIALGFLDAEETAPVAVKREKGIGGRPLLLIARQPKYLVAVICGMLGYSTMTLVMTATPLAMQHHHHEFSATAMVIQWHVLAMFLPSFFTGNLIARFGAVSVMLSGVMLGFCCVAINLLGTHEYHFQAALICLGLSWSFLFIGATTLLTSAYEPEEKHRAQAFNDFIVFSAVALASVSAGFLQNKYGWRAVNIGVIPALFIILMSLLWLAAKPEPEGSPTHV